MVSQNIGDNGKYNGNYFIIVYYGILQGLGFRV